MTELILKNILKSFILENQNDPAIKEQLASSGNGVARICLRDTIYCLLIDLGYHAETENGRNLWNEFFQVHQKRQQQIQNIIDYDNKKPLGPERHGRETDKLNYTLCNYQVLDNYTRLFRYIYNKNLPSQYLLYLSISNDLFISILASSNLTHYLYGPDDTTQINTLENLLDLKIIDKLFYDLLKKQSPTTTFHGTKSWRHPSDIYNLQIGSSDNYYPSSQILSYFTRYAGMGHVLILSQSLDPKYGDKCFFIRHDGGSNGYESEIYFNNYTKYCFLDKYIDDQGKLMTFQEAFDFISQETDTMEIFHSEKIVDEYQ